MPDQKQVDLKNPWLAAFLAWLVPGLGHAYQERWFKAVLYAVCIWGTFGCGWVLGDGKVVYFNMAPKRGPRTIIYFVPQLMVGSASLPAIYQTNRASPQGRIPERGEITLSAPLQGQFVGFLNSVNFTDSRRGTFRVTGEIEITPSEDREFYRSVRGKFVGNLVALDGAESEIVDGAKVECDIEYMDSLEPAIFPSPHREVSCRGVKGRVFGAKGGEFSGELQGKVLNVRPFKDRYAAPLDREGLEAAHGDLGKFFDVGLIYTCIAGLLNLLAIWDALEGPAYGYGNEVPATPGTTTTVSAAQGALVNSVSSGISANGPAKPTLPQSPGNSSG